MLSRWPVLLAEMPEWHVDKLFDDVADFISRVLLQGCGGCYLAFLLGSAFVVAIILVGSKLRGPKKPAAAPPPSPPTARPVSPPPPPASPPTEKPEGVGE